MHLIVITKVTPRSLECILVRDHEPVIDMKHPLASIMRARVLCKDPSQRLSAKDLWQKAVDLL